MGYRLRLSPRTAGWTMAVVVAAALLLLAVIPDTLPGMTPRELNMALAQLSKATGPPTYGLGHSAAGVDLDAIAVPPPGEGGPEFFYGPCQQSRFAFGAEGGCTNPVSITTYPGSTAVPGVLTERRKDQMPSGLGRCVLRGTLPTRARGHLTGASIS